LNRKALTIAFVVLIAVAGYGAYVLGYFNRPPKAAFSFRTPTRTLKYIAPTDRDLITFTNESSDPETPLEKLISTWYVRYNGTGAWKLLNSSTNHWGRLPVSNEKGHEIRLVVSDGVKEDSKTVAFAVDPSCLPEYPQATLHVQLKGMILNIGQPKWGDPVKDNLFIDECTRVIREDLGCNAIRIEGSYEDKILYAAQRAIGLGFQQIILNPRHIDASWEETVKNIRAFAMEAEKLRLRSNAIVLQVGTELFVDSTAISKGKTYVERCASISKTMKDDPRWNEKLTDFINELIGASSEFFHGTITYDAAWWEDIKWNRIRTNVICSNEYDEIVRSESVRDAFLRLKAHGRPVIAGEFGCVTFTGARKYGGYGWSYSGPYDEKEQAESIEHYLRIFNEVGIDGCYLFCVYEPKPDPATEFSVFRIDAGNILRRKLGFYAYQNFVLS